MPPRPITIYVRLMTILSLEEQGEGAREKLPVMNGRGGEMRVAIVGAGSAGLSMAKQLKDVGRVSGQTINYRIFERRGNIGGIWQYDQDPGQSWLAWERPQDASLLASDEHAKEKGGRIRLAWNGIGPKRNWPPSPMFDGLRTNIPSDLMTYRDSPFASSTNLFPSRAAVQSYLEEYAQLNFLLDDNVAFNTNVVSIKKDLTGVWSIKAKPVGDEAGSQIEETYTHVVLACGRCNTPNIPNVPGLENFKGEVLHSAWYRDPTKFLGKTVLVVGNASSGMDIARELTGYLTRDLPSGYTPSEWAAKVKDPQYRINVYSSWETLSKPPPMDFNPRDPTSPEWCRKIDVRGRIENIDEGNKISFSEGDSLDNVEVIVFGTGFLFDFPFMDQATEPLLSKPFLPPSEGSSARCGKPSSNLFNLDDWLLFHCQDETICTLGAPITVVPFPFSEAQACFVAHRWANLCPSLPKLDTTIPPKDAARWVSRLSSHSDPIAPATGDMLQPVSHVFGYPSDADYVDALFSFLPEKDAGMEAPWEEGWKSEVPKVEEQVEPEDGQRAEMGGREEKRGIEWLYATPTWRRRRRANGRVLRRKVLGY